MALHQAYCQVLATVEESQPPIDVPEENIIDRPQPYVKHPVQVELTEELISELNRQESCVSTDSLDSSNIDDASSQNDDSASSHNDADESSSDGGLEHEHRGHRSASVVSDASEEGGRDSGIEAEKEPDMIVPDQDMIDRIVTQVEIYFGDASVLKDKFLLKHIRRNKEGYVSLKLVSSFKKIKQLTKDWRVVAFALNKASTNIQTNDLGTKIRRITPLPEVDDTPVTCTILALNLPLEKPGIDTVSQLFGKCGDIALIRVLRAGAPLSAEIKPLASKHQSLNTTNCAWIEFEAPEAVKEACKLTSEDGMKVVPIISEGPKKIEKPVQQKSQPNSRKNSVANQNNIVQQRGPNSRKNSVNKYNKYGNEHDNYHQRPMQQRRKAISLPHNERPNLRDLAVIVEGRRRPKSKSCVEFPGQGPYPAQSWVHRHLFAAAVASAASTASPNVSTKPPMQRPSRVSLGTLTLPDGVKRFPKGPDGSKGFGFGSRRVSVVVPAN